jgi:hypothetical protein
MEDPIIEEIAEDVHKGWMAEKQKQGFADHPHRFVRQSNSMGMMVGACRPACDLNIEKHHPDMLPYAELADNVKEYDRATARAVFRGLSNRGYKVVLPEE